MSENEVRTTGWPPHRVTGVDVWPFRLHAGEPQLLLLHRVAADHAPAFWQGVSGWIEADEPPHLTALRELREETGLGAVAIFTLDAVFDLYKPRRGTVESIVPFAVEVADGRDPVLSGEHDEWRWASPAEALGLLPYEPQREAVRRVVADLLERPDRAHLHRIEIRSTSHEESR